MADKNVDSLSLLFDSKSMFVHMVEAVVGGNTLTNPFMVTEVYIKENGKWKMGSLTFSRLMRPVKTKQ